MKKILLFVVSIVAAVSLTACASSSGTSVENINTSDAPDASSISADDYDDSLDGLQEYFVALGYIPENSEPTEMMYSVIGAVDGVRYTFTVNSSTVYLELYEYDPDNLNDDATRVISEVKQDGKFYIFSDIETDETYYEAFLSDSEKYLMIYTDSSENEDNIQRKTDVEAALKQLK